MIAQSQRQLETSAHNLANMATPGFKRRVEFADFLSMSRSSAPSIDFSPGKLIETGRSTDLALEGAGFFVVRSEEQLAYTRKGVFQRDGDGRLVTSGGYALQSAGGGDLIVPEGLFQVAGDGVVVVEGEPVGRVNVVGFAAPEALEPMSDSLFRAVQVEPEVLEQVRLRQGAVESSNVDTGAEMVSLMLALRRAESGQKIAGVYDDLTGRALSVFGQV